MKAVLLAAMGLAGFAAALAGTASGAKGVRVVHCPLGAPSGVAAAGFSPDGARIAYAERSRDGYSVLVTTLTGRVVARRVPGLAGPPSRLLWAPSGTRIAYTSGSELHVVGASDRLLFSTTGTLELGGWTSDGGALVVSSSVDRGQAGLPSAESFLVDADSGTARDLGPGAHAAPAPDGTRVAVAVPAPRAGEPYAEKLEVISLATGDRRTIIDSVSPISALAWSPDSRQVAYLWDNDVEPSLMAQNADGSSSGLFGREHGALPTQVAMLGPISWTPRGIVGELRPPDFDTVVAFYDVVSGKERTTRNVDLAEATVQDVTRDGSRVAYVAGPDPNYPDAAPGAPGLRLLDWPGANDRALRPCRGSNRSDRIVVSPEPTTVVALAGDDVIDARNGARDTIACGPGTDTVRADRRDVVRNCEHVRRPAR